jgi:O-antigen/teichoic acid export membrane protein
LGTVLFPKASAMDAESNFKMSAAACRRTLLVTFLASAFLLVAVTPLIPVVYGSEFKPAATVFLILLPTGMLYTLHKVLGGSLSANGRPQTTLFAGLISLPFTIGLNVLLVPELGIKGAAIASNVAYAINSSVVLFFFVRASRLPLKDVLLFNGTDWEAVTWTARNLWQTKVLRRPGYSTAASE